MQTNSRFQRTTLFALVLSLLLMVAGSMPSQAQEKSLYQRIVVTTHSPLSSMILSAASLPTSSLSDSSSVIASIRRNAFASTSSINFAPLRVDHAFTPDVT
jgi:uncharacterized protein YcfL